MKDIFINSYKKFGQQGCLGITNDILGKIIPNQKGGSEIFYISYKETIDRAHRIGSAIINEKLFNQP